MSIEGHQITVGGLHVDVVRKPIKNLHLGVYLPHHRRGSHCAWWIGRWTLLIGFGPRVGASAGVPERQLSVADHLGGRRQRIRRCIRYRQHYAPTLFVAGKRPFQRSRRK